MRVELIYAPGCSTYSRARNILETVIAEERLPIPIELIEESGQEGGFPTIKIDGSVAHSLLHHYEGLRDVLCRRWKELHEAPLLGM
jgi:hypothetical protein